MYSPNRALGAPLRSVTIGTWFQIRLEYWLQHDLGCGLHHPVPNGRNPERPLPAPGLRDHHPSHRLWFVCLASQFLSEPVDPFLQPSRLNILETRPIHSRRSIIGSRQFIGMVQNIFPVHLVVELIETVLRLLLRLPIQLDLKFPYLARCCQAHHQSPLLSLFSSTLEVRVLPSTGITRLRWYI